MHILARPHLLTAVAATALLVPASVFAVRGQQTLQGGLPYVPTRIEWLALVSQASLRHSAATGPYSAYDLGIVNKDGTTIVIYVRYLPTVDREVLNKAVETAKTALQIRAKGYGWDSWLKIEEDVKAFDLAR